MAFSVIPRIPDIEWVNGHRCDQLEKNREGMLVIQRSKVKERKKPQSDCEP